MSLIDKIPELNDEDVINLLANARRLAAGADEKQRAAAEALLPALEAEAETRRAERLARTQAKRAAARKSTRVAA